LIELFCERPTIAFAVWRQTLIDASIFREAITNNSSRDALTRLVHLFCELYFRAKQAGLVKANICNLPSTQTQIGETLGMSLVSVNRNLQRLRKHAPADFKAGKLIVRDWEKLAALGEFDPQYLHQQLRRRSELRRPEPRGEALNFGNPASQLSQSTCSFPEASGHFDCVFGAIAGQQRIRPTLAIPALLFADYAGACHRAGHFGPDPLGSSAP
jgi:hypothetical protein